MTRYVYDTRTPICTDITVNGFSAIVDLNPAAVARLVDELSRPHPLVDVDELALAEHGGQDR